MRRVTEFAMMAFITMLAGCTDDTALQQARAVRDELISEQAVLRTREASLDEVIERCTQLETMEHTLQTTYRELEQHNTRLRSHGLAPE